jgi:hypothetical protein
MAKAIPKWVQGRVSKLYKKYGLLELTFEMIEKVLCPMDNRNTINAFLNELKKAEWIEVKPSIKDMRKKIYTLKEPNEILMDITLKDT